MCKNAVLLLIVGLFGLNQGLADNHQNNPPEIINANPDNSDPWYPYIRRPSKELAEKNKLYPSKILTKVPEDTVFKTTHIPWTFVTKQETLFPLNEAIPDRIIDSNGKSYIKMYHGTTSDLIDNFKPGSESIKFDVATNAALGKGFYMSGDPNEAKAYACARLKTRKTGYNDLQGLLLVIGVEDNEAIKGKYSKMYMSDEKGNSLDVNAFFRRNQRYYNQFVFFSNIAPYLKIFYIILLPHGFGASKSINDGDGASDTSTNTQFAISHCNA
jgi:hypothetical protein